MNKITTTFKRLNDPVVWIGTLVLVLALVAIIVSSKMLYDHTVELITENLRERILTISITAAANIDARDVIELQTKSDWLKPQWSDIVNTLYKVKYNNHNVVYVYILRLAPEDPSQVLFVADADSIDPFANLRSDSRHHVDVNQDGIIDNTGADKLQWPGQLYEGASEIPEIFKAYNGPVSSKEPYTDEFGTFMSGYAPIVDNRGNVVAILVTDIKADDFLSITTRTLQPFVIFIVFLTFVISILAVSIIATSRRHSKILEHSKNEVIELAEGLEGENDQLHILDKIKTEFVSVASHQLRSPLAVIRGYSSMLIDGDFGQIPNEAKEALGHIHESVKFMASSIEDYLSVSLIQSGNMKYDYSDFDIKDLAENTTQGIRPLAIEKGLLTLFTSTITQSAMVHADRGKTRQIIENLINNALKYTPSGSIHVFAHDAPEQKKFFVEVTDTGIGMSNESLQNIFGKFERAHNANDANISGTGLGLYIARKMAQDMGGDVTASSDGESKGTTFTITLPLKIG